MALATALKTNTTLRGLAFALRRNSQSLTRPLRVQFAARYDVHAAKYQVCGASRSCCVLISCSLDSLSNTEFSDEGCVALGEALKANKSLQRLMFVLGCQKHFTC